MSDPLPPPRHVSDAARAMLATPSAMPTPGYPAPDDINGWRAHVEAVDAAMEDMFPIDLAVLPVTVESDVIGGVPVFRAWPASCADPHGRRVFLDMHGGALVYFGGESCRRMAAFSALRVGMPIVSVDYRMPPDYPYPAGLDDCVAVYRTLLEDRSAGDIVIGGSSAGGNLAAATILKARDSGLPLPAGAVLLTPEVDLTESGDSFATNQGSDCVLPASLMALNRLYAGAAPLDEPYVSPVFGDFTAGFPRAFIQAGTRDLFLSNAINIHRALRRANVEAHLHVWEAMPHGGFFGAPEDEEIAAEIQLFLADCWRRPD